MGRFLWCGVWDKLSDLAGIGGITHVGCFCSSWSWIHKKSEKRRKLDDSTPSFTLRTFSVYATYARDLSVCFCGLHTCTWYGTSVGCWNTGGLCPTHVW